MFISPFEHIIAALAPLECRLCKRQGFMLCETCAVQHISVDESRCYLCNKLTTQHRICSSCRSKSALRRVWWLGTYSGILQELIYDLKYHRKRAFTREFGTHLAGSLSYLPEDTLVIPIPTASKRIRVRGYDQAVLIAAQFAHIRQLPFLQPLKRTTQVDQIGHNRAERFSQMQRSLELRTGIDIKGANILLIDDVLTTGATLESAAKLLRKHGAKHVDAAVIARHLR